MAAALTVRPELCTGCMACVYACSLVHEEVFSPGLSRVRIVKDESQGNSVPTQCLLCDGTPCVGSCPVGAITLDSSISRPVVQEAECVGCGSCVEACPVGAIRLHVTRQTALVCDMCSGQPQCVRVCIPGALSLSDGPQNDPAVSGADRRDAALRGMGRLKG